MRQYMIIYNMIWLISYIYTYYIYLILSLSICRNLLASIYMPSSFGVSDQTDLSPRNSFKDSRLCLGSLAGVQPPQEPWSKTRFNESEVIRWKRTAGTWKSPNRKGTFIFQTSIFWGSAFLFSRVCRWYFCVVKFLISFQRWPGVCNSSVSDSQQRSERSMSTFRYEKTYIESSPKTSLDLLLVASLRKHVQRKKRGEMAKAMSLVGITNPYQILLLILMIHTHQPREDHRVIVTYIIDCFSHHLPIKTLGKVSHSNSLIWIYIYIQLGGGLNPIWKAFCQLGVNKNNTSNHPHLPVAYFSFPFWG